MPLYKVNAHVFDIEQIQKENVFCTILFFVSNILHFKKFSKGVVCQMVFFALLRPVSISTSNFLEDDILLFSCLKCVFCFKGLLSTTIFLSFFFHNGHDFSGMRGVRVYQFFKKNDCQDILLTCISHSEVVLKSPCT